MIKKEKVTKWRLISQKRWAANKAANIQAKEIALRMKNLRAAAKTANETAKEQMK